MFDIIKRIAALAKTLKEGNQPSLSIPVAGLRIHLAHCSLHPQRGLEIGLAFNRDGHPAPVAIPAAISNRHRGNVIDLASIKH